MHARTLPRLLMTIAAGGTYAVAALMTRLHAHEPTVALAALADIVFTVPAIAFFLLVRRSLARWTLPLILMVVGMSAGLLLVPDSNLGDYAAWRHDAWVGLRRLMMGMVAARVLMAADSLYHRDGSPQPITALRRLTGSDTLARMLLQEARVQTLGFAGWFRMARSGQKSFTQHHTSGLKGLLVTFAVLLMVETVGLHLVLSLWSPVAAWVATGSSLYALIWLAALYQSVRLNPVMVGEGRVIIGAGLRGHATVDLSQISRVEAVTAVDHRQDHYLRAAILTEPNLLLTLKYPATAVDLGGRERPVTRIGLYLDDPAGFRRALPANA